MYAWGLAPLQEPPTGVVPIGTIYRETRPAFESAANAQITQAQQKQGTGDIRELLTRGDTWTVSA